MAEKHMGAAGNDGEQQDDQAGAAPANRDVGQAAPAAKSDPFAAAFKAAQVELGEVEADKPAKKPAPKAKAGDDGEADKKPAKPDEKAKKPDQKDEKADKAKAKAKDGADEGDDDDQADGEDEDKPKKAEPLKARRHWSARRQEEFAYLDPETQRAWLAEDIKPLETWDEPRKAMFAALPDPAKEEFLAAAKELEKGYQTKFQALANERKAFADIEAAIPPRVRAVMQQRGADVATAFKTLVRLQDFAMADPVGYVADFIKRGKLDVNAIADALGDTAPARQASRQDPDELVRNHPAVAQMAQQIKQLEGQLAGYAKQQTQVAETEFNALMMKRDAGGQLVYPYARLLGGYMADLLEEEPESFEGLSQAEQFDQLYKRAVAAHPELRAAKAAKPRPADEADAEDEDDAEDERTKRAKEARTRKSSKPHTAPSGKPRDAFAAAYEAAAKQTGFR